MQSGGEYSIKHDICKWNYTFYTTFQITKSGEPVTKLDTSSPKQPFELIFFAATESCSANWLRVLKTDEQKQQRVIVSVPSAVHSHKPPLDKLLTEMGVLNENSKCLEIFGRYLIPNWTTFGNQCLKFQDLNYFEKMWYK